MRETSDGMTQRMIGQRSEWVDAVNTWYSHVKKKKKKKKIELKECHIFFPTCVWRYYGSIHWFSPCCHAKLLSPANVCEVWRLTLIVLWRFWRQGCVGQKVHHPHLYRYKNVVGIQPIYDTQEQHAGLSQTMFVVPATLIETHRQNSLIWSRLFLKAKLHGSNFGTKTFEKC